jgi:hypothetical protein
METTRLSERRGWNNQRMCTAHRSGTKELCGKPAMRGQNVCQVHGGSAPAAKRNAKLRLLELVDPAIATLAREMTSAKSSKDRMAAANSILDRAGYGRVSQVEVADAREMLVARLIALRDGALMPPIELEGTTDGHTIIDAQQEHDATG